MSAAARVDRETTEHLAVLAAAPYIPEMHADDCDDKTCVRCWVLTPSNLYSVDTWLDNAGVFAKQFWEYVDGENIVTGLRIGQGESRVVAKFGNTIVRHYGGKHTVRPTQEPTGELTAAEWNTKYPVGTRVMAYPGVHGEDGFATWTTSRAWTTHGHTPVALVENHSSYIKLTHLDPIGVAS
ncbi:MULTISPECIES: hypothetical protein [unclassified Streptomyces]|uniref:hypothetical protein n=1 Tax=unclassified Streptomyces TaxID=2593676 RepID=UPI000BF012EA|nr:MULTISPECIES: hypothetical protein [unclassified Streptomyces]